MKYIEVQDQAMKLKAKQDLANEIKKRLDKLDLLEQYACYDRPTKCACSYDEHDARSAIGTASNLIDDLHQVLEELVNE
jgi:hypothetical protein